MHSFDLPRERTKCLVSVIEPHSCLSLVAIRLIDDSNYCFGSCVASAGHNWCVWPFELLLLSMRL